MKLITKVLLILILVLPWMGAQKLLAEGINAPGTESLIIKQYSLDGSLEKSGAGESQLTFRLLLDSGSGIDAVQWLTWMEEGLIVVDGIRFKLKDAVVKGNHKLSVPYEYEKPQVGEYFGTTMRISGNARYAAAEAELSLYSGVDSIVEITAPGSRFRTNRQMVGHENFRFDGQRSRPDQLAYVVLPSGEEVDQPKSSFLFRNRYWLAGATALAVSGTSALILNNGDSVAYLPVPPGRP